MSSEKSFQLPVSKPLPKLMLSGIIYTDLSPKKKVKNIV